MICFRNFYTSARFQSKLMGSSFTWRFISSSLWFSSISWMLMLLRMLQKLKVNEFSSFFSNIFEAKAENWKRVSKIETVLFFERCTQTILKAFGNFGERLWRKSFVCSKQSDNTRHCKPNSYRKFQNAKIKSQSSVVQLLTWCEKKTPGLYQSEKF